MKDPRITRLANLLAHHSTELEAGDRVLIEATDVPSEIVTELIRAATAAGAVPLVSIKQNSVLRELYRNATSEQMQLIGEIEKFQMEKVQAYIGLRGATNSSELSDVPGDQMKLYQKYWWQPVHTELRVNKTRWVVLRWPTPSMAQQAEMSTSAFEDFYFSVCTMDYTAMEKACEPLVEWMTRADRVHITGPGTDLSFSIKDIPVIPCFGKRNIPDGECFTAPVRDSVEGVIAFNTPTPYRDFGMTFEHLKFTLKAGKIVEATGSDTPRINEVLDADEGARYIGEWSLGFNPFILQPMKDTLFDEKIAGSFHFTPGNAYDIADNGNRSQIHWDIVMVQRPEWGGGEIWFDDTLIRKDGLFVPAALKGLNPDALRQ
ncbi:MAG TPA: aminopeptidase [Armatimonadota bacterium]|nr:aminopeptidase [Armatimonadota bacterium]